MAKAALPTHLGFKETDRQRLEIIHGITSQALGDIDKVEERGLKIFLDFLQRHRLFGRDLNSEINTLYILIKEYKTAYERNPTSNETRTARQQLVIHTATITRMLDIGKTHLHELTEAINRLIGNEKIIGAAITSYFKDQAPSPTKAYVERIVKNLNNALIQMVRLVYKVKDDFKDVYEIVQEKLRPSITLACTTSQEMTLDPIIGPLQELHFKIKKLVDDAIKEHGLLEEEKQYDRQICQILGELISMERQQLTVQHVQQRMVQLRNASKR